MAKCFSFCRSSGSRIGSIAPAPAYPAFPVSQWLIFINGYGTLRIQRRYRSGFSPDSLVHPRGLVCAAGPQKYILLSYSYYNPFLFQSTEFFVFFSTFLFCVYVKLSAQLLAQLPAFNTMKFLLSDGGSWNLIFYTGTANTRIFSQQKKWKSYAQLMASSSIIDI